MSERGEGAGSAEVVAKADEFLRYYSDLCHLDMDRVSPETLEANRQASAARFRTSLPFLESLPVQDVNTILDVGAGYGLHCEWFAQQGKDVTAIVSRPSADLAALASRTGFSMAVGDMHFLDIPDASIDMVWSSHALEHSFSPLWALWEWRRVLKAEGYLAVTVPPHKTEIVGGHFNVGWSLGQLVYLLGCVGFDITNGSFLVEGYNVRGLVRRGEDLSHRGKSWLKNLRERLPVGVQTRLVEKPKSLGRYAFDGSLQSVNGESAVVARNPGRPFLVRMRAMLSRFVRRLKSRRGDD